MAKQQKIRTILVVDDDLDVREMVAEQLGENGYKAIVAPNGLAALEIFKSRKVDAVLSDVHMPQGDGIALCKGVHEANPKIPFIFMSGDLSAAGNAASACAVLSKTDDFLNTVIAMLNKIFESQVEAYDELVRLVGTVVDYFDISVHPKHVTWLLFGMSFLLIAMGWGS